MDMYKKLRYIHPRNFIDFQVDDAIIEKLNKYNFKNEN